MNAVRRGDQPAREATGLSMRIGLFTRARSSLVIRLEQSTLTAKRLLRALP